MGMLDLVDLALNAQQSKRLNQTREQLVHRMLVPLSVAVLIIAALLLTSCGGNQSALLGTWKRPNTGQLLIFDSSENVSFGDCKGTYQFLDDNHIAVDMGGCARASLEVVISNNTLELIGEGFPTFLEGTFVKIK